MGQWLAFGRAARSGCREGGGRIEKRADSQYHLATRQLELCFFAPNSSPGSERARSVGFRGLGHVPGVEVGDMTCSLVFAPPIKGHFKRHPFKGGPCWKLLEPCQAAAMCSVHSNPLALSSRSPALRVGNQKERPQPIPSNV